MASVSASFNCYLLSNLPAACYITVNLRKRLNPFRYGSDLFTGEINPSGP